jgi:hypothetical protein
MQKSTAFQLTGDKIAEATDSGLRLANPSVWVGALANLPAECRTYIRAWALLMQEKLDAGARLADIWWATSFEASPQSVRDNTLETAIMVLAESGWNNGCGRELREVYYQA